MSPCWKTQPESEPFYRAVGANIRWARDGSMLSQRQVGEAVKLSRVMIANIEAGRQRVSSYTLARIAAVLNVPVSDLFPR